MDDTGLSKQEKAFDYIRTRILNGQFPYSYRLVASRIARELGLSVGTVREAIWRLEAAGWVNYDRNVGATVTTMDAKSFADTLQTLGVLEGLATGLTSPLLKDEDFEKLTEANRLMKQANEQWDSRKASYYNRVFHHATYDRCPNAHLLKLIGACWDRTDVGRIFLSVPRRPAESAAEHEQLVAMLKAREAPAAIEAFVRQHKERTLSAFRQATGTLRG